MIHSEQVDRDTKLTFALKATVKGHKKTCKDLTLQVDLWRWMKLNSTLLFIPHVKSSEA